MALIHCRGTTDFGDAMNVDFWPRLVPDFERLAATRDVYGIGTILARRHVGPSRRKLVLGSGAGYGRPLRIDAHWEIAWVRGPRTARALGLPQDRALGDPALLLRQARPDLPWSAPERPDVVLMPHYASASRGDFRRLAAAVGATLCDPASPLDTIVGRFARARLVVTESLHGALLADLMRIPWLPFVSSAHVAAFEWQDACESLGLRYEPVLLPAPMQSHVPGLGRAIRRSARRALAWLRLGPAHDRLAYTRASTPRDLERNARMLSTEIARRDPQLSDARRQASMQAAMLERLAALRTGPRACAATAADARSVSPRRERPAHPGAPPPTSAAARGTRSRHPVPDGA